MTDPATVPPRPEPCGYLLAHVNAPERGRGPSPCHLPKGHDGWHEYAPMTDVPPRPEDER